MAASKILFGVLALYAFIQISAAFCGGCGCGGCCEPITEITTVSCVPVVETFIEPACGFGYPGFYDGFYGLPGYGYPAFYDLPGYGFHGLYDLPGCGYPGFYDLPGCGYPGFYDFPGYGYPGLGLPALYDFPGYGYPALALPACGLPAPHYGGFLPGLGCGCGCL